MDAGPSRRLDLNSRGTGPSARALLVDPLASLVRRLVYFGPRFLLNRRRKRRPPGIGVYTRQVGEPDRMDLKELLKRYSDYYITDAGRKYFRQDLFRNSDE